ncbi:hypothetical protein JCM10908_005967 [Rhodotorula pacifica]|uniref:DNA-directed DNA polymerase eta n=1 Tax=Rhodotorula pacifica TaxID=1495444 RepID=UPI003178019F
MGSPPIPDRLPPPPSTRASTSSSRPIGFGDAPPRPHPGIRPAVAPASVPFSPPKRRTGGSIMGKERAALVDGDGDDEEGEEGTAGDLAFPPQVRPTYRHVLGSGNGGAANPLRTIAHIDIDAAYAAMEMARLKIPQDQPMAVQQWNGLIAVNYPARAYGITRHETPAEALKKCPDLMLVHVQTYKNGETEPGYWDGAKPETHKVSLDMYRKESKKILAVFADFCPIVEKASIDESFLDLTLPVRQRLLSLYPSLSVLPPSATLDTPLPTPAELGITASDIKWHELGNLVPVEGQKREKVRRLDPMGVPMPASSSSPVKASQVATMEGTGEGEGEGGNAATIVEESEDLEAMPPPPPAQPDPNSAHSNSESPEPIDPPLSWSDICLSLGAAIVRDTRAAVTERLGYTCSAGIATNKMFAKLTSAWKKPNAQTILRHSTVPAFLRPMPFQKIRNLGGKLGNAVKETYEANTVGDLLEYSLPELKAKIGDSSGMWLWEIVRGLDYTEVDPKTAVKSMLSSKNFRPYINKYGEVMHWMNILATELHLRLNDAREETPGLWPKTITFTHRSPSFVIRSHQAPFPFTSNLTRTYILKAGEKLFRVAIGAGQSTERITDQTTIGPYSNLQLSFSGLEKLEGGQRGIEGFFTSAAVTAGASTNGGSAASNSTTRTRAKSGSAPPADDGPATTVNTRASSNPPKKRVASFFSTSTKGSEDDKPPASKKRKQASTATKAKRDSPALVSVGANADGTEQLILASSSDEAGEDDVAKEDEDHHNDKLAIGSKKKRRVSLPRFTCPKCSKTITVPGETRRKLEQGEIGVEKAQEALEKEKAEHADWHVARELLEKERKAGGWTSSSVRSGNGTSSNSNGGKKKRKSDSPVAAPVNSNKKKKKSKSGGAAGTLNGFVSRG